MVFSWWNLLEKPENLSDCDVSPASVANEFYDSFSWCTEWEFVEPQSYSFSKKRAHSCSLTQEEMRFGGPQVKAPPPSRRRTMPPTTLQNSCSSCGEEQGHFEVEDPMWSARDRTIIAKTKQYLEEKTFEAGNLRVGISATPDDTDVDFCRNLEEARDEKRCPIFETFSADGSSEILVVSRLRWDKHLQVKDSGKRVWKGKEWDGALWKEG